MPSQPSVTYQAGEYVQMSASELWMLVDCVKSDKRKKQAMSEEMEVDIKLKEEVEELRSSKKKGKAKETSGEGVMPVSSRVTRVKQRAIGNPSGGETASGTEVPVCKLIPYVEIDSLNILKPEGHLNDAKCSLCIKKWIPCWSMTPGTACNACWNARSRCKHSSFGPVTSKNPSAAPPITIPAPSITMPTSPTMYNPHTACQMAPVMSTPRAATAAIPMAPSRSYRPYQEPVSAMHTAIPEDKLPVPAPSSSLPLVASPPRPPTHARTQSSPTGKKIEVPLVSVEGVASEICGMRAATEENMRELARTQDQMREMQGGMAKLRWDMRDMSDVVRTNSDVMRDLTLEMRRARLRQEAEHRDRRMEYGDRSRGGSGYEGSQGGRGV